MSERFADLRRIASIKRRTHHPVSIADLAEVLSALDAAEAEARENVARWMIAHSFATGHGDTLTDLLDELSGQVRGQLDRMLTAEARVKVLEVRIKLLEEGLRLPDAKRRLWFISDILATRGAFNRSDLCSSFGISVPQASKDIQNWLKRHPNSAIYNKSTKRYEVSSVTDGEGGAE